jgi:hypothetical protein
MTKRKWLLLMGASGAVVALGVAVGWGIANRPCGTLGLKASLRTFRATEAAWSDAVALAGSTPRLTLAGPVGGLQQVRERARSEDLGPCFAEVKRLELEEMDAAIEEYLAFMRSEKERSEAATILAAVASEKKASALDLVRERVEPEKLAQERAERSARAKEAQIRKERDRAEEAKKAATERAAQAAEAVATAARLELLQKEQEEARLARAQEEEVARIQRARVVAERDMARKAAQSAWVSRWPESYVAPMAPVKAALGAMLRDHVHRASHCEEFRVALAKVDFPAAFAAGGPDVWFQARKVKEALEGVAVVCGAEGTADLDEALSGLTRALRPFGLRP